MAPDEAAKEEAGRKEDPPAPVPVAPVIPPPPAPGWVAPPMRRVLPATTPSAAPPPESSASSPASPSAGARDAGLQTRPADRLDRPASRPASRASWLLLPVLVLLGAGGYWLWQQGRFQPLLSLARPLMASIGLPAGAAPREAPAMVREIKQLLHRLHFQPGPLDGNLDPTTEAAIRAYQAMAGVPVDGRPSAALLDDLRAVAADQRAGG